MMSSLKSDIEATKLYDAPTPASKSPVKQFDTHISITEFIDDLKLRFPKEFAASVQTLVYFYSQLSTYEYSEEFDFGFNISTKHYIVFRPEMITFVCYDEKIDKTKLIVKTKNLDVYARFGVRFETHIPCRKWDDSAKKFTHEIIPDKFKADRELRTNSQINMIRIINQKQSYDKPKAKYDFRKKNIEYYNWRIEGVKDSEKLAQYMLQNMKVEQFKNIMSADSIEGADLVFDN